MKCKTIRAEGGALHECESVPGTVTKEDSRLIKGLSVFRNAFRDSSEFILLQNTAIIFSSRQFHMSPNKNFRRLSSDDRTAPY